MDEFDQVRTLLQDAADMAGPFAAPPVDALGRGRRRHGTQLRTAFAAACVTALVIVLAVGLSVLARRAPHQPATADRSGQLAAPDPTGPGVGVAALMKYRWQALPPAPIPARSDAAVVWTGTRMLVWGGQLGDQLRNDGAAYDPVRRTWTTLPPAPLTPRVNMASAWVGGSFLIWGGNDASHAMTDGARYDPATNRWTKLPAAPAGFHGLASIAVDGDRTVLTAVAPGTRGSRTVDAVTYRPASDSWSRLPQLSLPPNHLTNQIGLVATDRLVLWAYWSHTVQDVPNGTRTTFGVDARQLNAAGTGWQATRYDPDRLVVQPFWTGRSLILMGEDIWCGYCSHPAGIHVPSTVIDARSGRSTAITDGPLSTVRPTYVWMGAAVLAFNSQSAVGHTIRPGDLAAWNPTANRWTTLPNGAGLAAEPQVVWAGDRLLAWGGQTYAGHHLTGAEYAPPAREPGPK